ncbi:MAG: glycosyltransferase [Bdellovibrionota bacterium]|nr:glycosyltransferase [Bdellovibrionota bacterium]
MSSLSIIVPAFNRADLLEICLGNLLAQVCPGDEILVVDDGSSDEARRLLERFEREHPPIKLYRLNRNYGQGHARNHGASLAENSILVFVDSDVDIGPGNLARVRDFFDENPKASAVTGRLSLTHPYPSFFSRYKNTYMNYIFGCQAKRVNFLYGSICAIRSSAFMPWPERYLGVEDSELGLRMAREGHELYFLSDLEVIHFKNYSFKSLLKNDFKVPFGFARCFWLFQGWKAYLPWGHQEKFSHIQIEQVYSLLIVVLTLAFLFIPELRLIGVVSGLILFGTLNFHFFKFLLKNEGLRFSVLSFFWTFFDQFVMINGALCGLIYHGFLIHFTKEGRKSTISGEESLDES